MMPRVPGESFLRREAPCGAPYGEVASALQKSIRLGRVRQALYWATQYAPYPNALAIRIVYVICSEDVGYGSPLLVKHAPLGPYTSVDDRLLRWVVALCLAAPKSRGFCTLSGVLNDRPRPDPTSTRADCLFAIRSAVDAAVAAPSVASFETACAAVDDGYLRIRRKRYEPVSDLDLPDLSFQDLLLEAAPDRHPHDRAAAHRLVQIATKTRQRLSCRMVLFHLVHLVVFHGRMAGTYTAGEYAALEVPEPQPEDVPDYALDKHTARGKRMGRGMAHFFDVAARVVPAGDDPWHARCRAIYVANEAKRAGAAYFRNRRRTGPPPLRRQNAACFFSPSKRAREPAQTHSVPKRHAADRVLAQLPCGDKPETYFVRTEDGGSEFVKSRVTPAQLELSLECDEWKRKLPGLEPVGVRGTDAGELRAPNLFGTSWPVPSRPHPRHPSVRVADLAQPWTKAHARQPAVLRGLAVQLLFRKCMRLRDTVSRNLVLARGRVWSVDEVSREDEGTPVGTKLTSKPNQFVRPLREALEQHLRNHADELAALLQQWAALGFCLARVAILVAALQARELRV